jgi:hypothetical protein
MTDDDDGPHAPAGYIVDVCRYCGALAVWPGCRHWQVHADWTMGVRVKLPASERRRIEGSIRALAE